MMDSIFTSLRVFLFFTTLTGVVYPAIVTAVARLHFKRQADGSLIERDGRTIGSELIGQAFTNPAHFWSRPSAIDYNPMPSGGSNLGPTSTELKTKIADRRARGSSGEMLFSSGSGLDPHISPESARAQIPRILELSDTNKISEARLKALVGENTEKRQFGVLGEPRVNVLKLNLALDLLRK